MHFAKKIKLLIDGFSSFFVKRRKSEESMIHQKKNSFTERPRSLNPGKAIAMVICPIIVHFITELARARCRTRRANLRAQ